MYLLCQTISSCWHYIILRLSSDLVKKADMANISKYLLLNRSWNQKHRRRRRRRVDPSKCFCSISHENFEFYIALVSIIVCYLSSVGKRKSLFSRPTHHLLLLMNSFLPENFLRAKSSSTRMSKHIILYFSCQCYQ